MSLLPRARLFLVRHPWVRWALIVALAAGAAASTAGALQRVDAARRAWGESRAVMVAAEDLSPGDELLVEPRSVPRALVPAGAVVSVPVGAVAHQYVGTGEIVTVDDLATAGWVPPGGVALAISTEGRAPLAVGDRVRVFAAGLALADGSVVRVDEEAVVVAVPEDAAAAVSAAAGARAAVVGRLSG